MALEYVKERTPKVCFYSFLSECSLIECKCIQDKIDKFVKDKNIIENITLYIYKEIYKKYKDSNYIDKDSFKYIKESLLKESRNNKYILDDDVDIEFLKEIALSNNELIVIDKGKIKEIHKILANKIIKEEDLEKESF